MTEAAQQLSNLQLARLKNKKPASKISGKDGFSEVP